MHEDDETTAPAPDADDRPDGDLELPRLRRGVVVFSLGMMAFSFVPWGIALTLIATGALADGNAERIFVGSLFVVSQVTWSIGLFYGGAKYVSWWRTKRRLRRTQSDGGTT
jgi:hypothetical protein